MKFRNMMLKYYSQAGEGGEGGGGGAGGEGGEGGQGGEPPAKDPSKEPGAEGGKGGEGGQGGEGGKPKLSDNEAQLLKDMMKHSLKRKFAVPYKGGATNTNEVRT